LLFVSAFDVIPEPTRSIIMVLNIVLAIGCLLLGFSAILFLKKSESAVNKNFYVGLSIVFILVGIARVIFIYHDFFATDEYDILLWKIANFVVLIGFTSLSYIIETHIYKRTKHVFTLIGVVFIALYMIIFDKAIATIILYIGTAALLLLPLLLYIIIAKNSTGELRKKALVIIGGMVILIVAQGTGLIVTIGLMDKTFSLIIGPPLALVGFFIVWYGFVTQSR